MTKAIYQIGNSNMADITTIGGVGAAPMLPIAAALKKAGKCQA